ncbi:hypothetical protein J7I98_07610 [Streptomyces sp. ISL-98]|uniref:hypothetical protein n=1 Tax=Streptomyces sp. ISL-98 TaxID=2819192 RepID=UPI001BE6D3BB|nr:hypothetical protein [Streptomyces sp. ISL-98]MBT2505770.1 hypothetical protein [Streptomyces sp. ISL-98]
MSRYAFLAARSAVADAPKAAAFRTFPAAAAVATALATALAPALAAAAAPFGGARS